MGPGVYIVSFVRGTDATLVGTEYLIPAVAGYNNAESVHITQTVY